LVTCHLRQFQNSGRSGIGILPMLHSTHPRDADATNFEF